MCDTIILKVEQEILLLHAFKVHLESGTVLRHIQGTTDGKIDC